MDLEKHYLAYLAALNERRFDDLSQFVAPALTYNDAPTTLAEYQAERAREVALIPDLFFDAQLVVASPERVAARLWFDCTPVGEFLGFAVNGRRLEFAEHVFYEFRDGLIVAVVSMLDVPSIAAQVGVAAAADPGS